MSVRHGVDFSEELDAIKDASDYAQHRARELMIEAAKLSGRATASKYHGLTDYDVTQIKLIAENLKIRFNEISNAVNEIGLQVDNL